MLQYSMQIWSFEMSTFAPSWDFKRGSFIVGGTFHNELFPQKMVATFIGISQHHFTINITKMSKWPKWRFTSAYANRYAVFDWLLVKWIRHIRACAFDSHYMHAKLANSLSEMLLHFFHFNVGESQCHFSCLLSIRNSDANMLKISEDVKFSDSIDFIIIIIISFPRWQMATWCRRSMSRSNVIIPFMKHSQINYTIN